MSVSKGFGFNNRIGARRTVQVAVRTPKKDGTWSYAVLVSTDTTATLEELLLEYDKRSGAPENSFGLSSPLFAKIQKDRIYAQQVLVPDLDESVVHN